MAIFTEFSFSRLIDPTACVFSSILSADRHIDANPIQRSGTAVPMRDI